MIPALVLFAAVPTDISARATCAVVIDLRQAGQAIGPKEPLRALNGQTSTFMREDRGQRETVRVTPLFMSDGQVRLQVDVETAYAGTITRKASATLVLGSNRHLTVDLPAVGFEAETLVDLSLSSNAS